MNKIIKIFICAVFFASGLQAMQHSSKKAGCFHRVLRLFGLYKIDAPVSLFGQTPLYVAAAHGESQECKSLLGAGANPDIPDNGRTTPLIIAAAQGRVQICELLLDAGANVNAANNCGETPLYLAAGVDKITCGEKAKTCELLLARGANPHVALPMWGDTPLHAAVSTGRGQVCEMLINAKVDLNCLSMFGGTPLHRAVYESKQELCKLLLAAGADPNFPNKNGEIALRGAKNVPIGALLIEAMLDEPKKKIVRLIGVWKKNNYLGQGHNLCDAFKSTFMAIHKANRDRVRAEIEKLPHLFKKYFLQMYFATELTGIKE